MKKTQPYPCTNAAKAVLTLNQTISLMEGHPITIRLPATTTSSPVKIELVREPLKNGVRFTYTIIGDKSVASGLPLDMSFIDKAFNHFHGIFEDLQKGIDWIFKLPPPK